MPTEPKTSATPPAKRRFQWSIAGAALAALGLWGTPVGAAEAPGAVPARKLWSLQPVGNPPVPAVRDTTGLRTPVDAFIQSTLEARGIQPDGVANRPALLRRVALDLTGIPPTPAEVDAFVKDTAPEAFDRVVERLLASPQYGERSARHWLDLARYAESEGFKADETRPNAWRYRDYVVTAFNSDTPYDRFVREQIAGDELWPDDPKAHVATGFNRHYPDESNARNLMQRRQEILNDITDTVGSVFTGLTFACARCHDHKFDPISQADYYRLQAFFANTAANDRILLVSEAERQRHRERLAAWEERTQPIRDAMEKLEAPHRQAILEDYITKYPDNIQVALKKSPAERTPFEHQMVAKARLYLDPESHQYLAPPSACAGRMKKEEKAQWQELKRQLDSHAALHPGPLPMATGIADVADEPPATHLLSRGNWNSPKDEVQPGFPAVLGLPAPEIVPVIFHPGAGVEKAGAIPSVPGSRRSSGRRAALAMWLTDPANPLTARVMVNRIWQQHFGRGLVATPGDFGFKGEAPTHPELLDWLAGEFVRSGWSVKHLHRLIVRSAVYQRDSGSNESQPAAAAQADPENRFLWRYPRHRMEGEAIRDAALAVSGRINLGLGGPSVFPELPPGMETRGGWKLSDDPAARERRSVYVFVRRNTRYPMFETFDMPDTHETCSRRNVTTSPVQALTLLNSRLTHEWAQSFAGRVLSISGTDVERQIEQAWNLAFCRRPAADERRMARDFLSSQARLVAEHRQRGEPIALPTPLPRTIASQLDRDHASALVDFCHALLNSNEFVYLE